MLTKPQRALFLDKMDSSGDGRIDIAEFRAAVEAQREALGMARPVVGGAGAGDGGGSGATSAVGRSRMLEEASVRAWQAVLGHLSANPEATMSIEELFGFADENGDG